MLRALYLLLVIVMAGCTNSPRSVNEDIVGDCGAGLDKRVSLKLSAKLKKVRKGSADVGFQNSLRAACPLCKRACKLYNFLVA